MHLSKDAEEVLRTIAAIKTVGSAFDRADGEELKLSAFCLENAHCYIPASIIDKARSAVVLLDATASA
jgi:hypothetical protein